MCKHYSQLKRNILAAITLLALTACIAAPAAADSLYVNIDLNYDSPIRAYDIQPSPSYLAFQADSNQTRYGGVGLAIDTDSETLFVTFEISGTLDIVDAKTLQVGTNQVTAPGANNLAGIVVDQDLARVYTVDRGTDNLYVYDWDAILKTLTLVAQYDLPGQPTAYGLALDELNDILYVTAATSTVYYYDTSDFTTLAGTISLQNPAIGIAVDAKNGLLYTGAGFASRNHFSQYDLVAGNEATIPSLGSGIGVMGVAVHPDSSLVYVTTGYSEDAVRVYDSSLSLLYKTGDIGNPTGIVAPGKDISFNPLNLAKDDGLDIDLGECVGIGQDLTYTVSFDNAVNNNPVTGVSIVDALPPEVSYVSDDGGGSYDSVTHTVTWAIGTLPAGDLGDVFELVVNIDPLLATPGGTITNACTISSVETGPTTQNEQTLICPNQPPVADAGGDQSVECGGPGTEVTLDGSGSTDPDSTPATNDDIVSFEWYADFGTVDEVWLDSGEIVNYPFPLGEHSVTLLVTDSNGVSDADTVTIEVLDSTSPIVMCSVDKSLLWPPNHNLIEVGLGIVVDDICDDDPLVSVAVYADEDDEEFTGDGNHSPDAKDDGQTLRLRAERKGNADGRVYLIIVTAVDRSGNVGVACCTVVVPHSPNGSGVQSVEAQADAAQAYCEATGDPPPSYFLVGDGAIIGPKQ